MTGAMKPALRPDDALKLLLASALPSVGDDTVAFCLVNRGAHARKCPRRLRPKSEVLSRAGSRPKPVRLRWYEKLVAGVVGFGLWLMEPFDFLGDLLYSLVARLFRGIRWIFRTRKTRRRMTQLKGGWKSHAGCLDASMCIHGDKALVVGEELMSLVYVGDGEVEVGWQHPLTDVARVELATWRSADTRGATLRWHFQDGSWVDVFAKGPGWESLAEAVPHP